MLKRFSLIAVALLLLVGGIVAYITIGYNYSDGDRAGNIVKFSRKGYIFKTHEGQLQLGSSNSIWDFSVTDEAVATQLQDAANQGKRVVLKYHEKLYQFDWRGDTKYIVYEVDPVK